MLNLKMLRKNTNLTQVECAEALNIPMTTFRYYEQGRANPPLETMIRIADFFGCSVDYLIGHQMPEHTQKKEVTMLQKQLCGEILKLDERDCGRVEAYIEAIKSKNAEQERIRKRFQEEV